MSKNVWIKVIFVSLIVILQNLVLPAQTAVDISLPRLTPVSPQAALLKRDTDCPVDLSNGSVPIVIPLYEVKDGDLTLPITLSYHSGGIKVKDPPGIVGLGWTLNAEPSVARFVQGLPDEVPNGYLKNKKYGTAGIDNDYKIDLVNGEYDEEPDIYHYKLIGKSGKFYPNRSAGNQFSYYLHPFQPVKIPLTPDDGMIILDEDGTIYEFGYGAGFVEKTNCRHDHISRYLAKSIKSARSGKISFSYGYETSRNDVFSLSHTVSIEARTNLLDPKIVITKTDGGRSENYTWSGSELKPAFGGPKYRSDSYSPYKDVKGRLLSNIIFSEGSVFFDYGDNIDLLSEISVLDKQNRLVRKIELFHTGYGKKTRNVTCWTPAV